MRGLRPVVISIRETGASKRKKSLTGGQTVTYKKGREGGLGGLTTWKSGRRYFRKIIAEVINSGGKTGRSYCHGEVLREASFRGKFARNFPDGGREGKEQFLPPREEGLLEKTISAPRQYPSCSLEKKATPRRESSPPSDGEDGERVVLGGRGKTLP